jgi:hypothetical protein
MSSLTSQQKGDIMFMELAGTYALRCATVTYRPWQPSLIVAARLDVAGACLCILSILATSGLTPLGG